MQNRRLTNSVRARSPWCLLLFVALAFALPSACGGDEGAEVAGTSTPTAGNSASAAGTPTAFASELVTIADAPAKLAVAPDGRLFYSEYLTGNIRIIGTDGQLLKEPFAHVDIAEYFIGSIQVWGLFGLAFDPEFEKNHYLYAFLMRPTSNGGQATVMRFTDIDNHGSDPTVLLGDLPEVNATPHIGGNILFGPDGYLYVSLGDFTAEYSPGPEIQDLSFTQGKILRVDRNGSAPPDNPFVDMPDADPRIWAYGLRNVFDFTFHPVTGRIYATDNGLVNCDELNVVDRGGNYGWPQSLDAESCGNAGAVEPIYLYAYPDKRPDESGSSVGPTAVEFLTDTGDLLLTCEVNTGFMRLLRLQGPEYVEVIEDSVIAEDCTLDIARAPDGTIYYSNGGYVAGGEIRRLVVPESVAGP